MYASVHCVSTSFLTKRSIKLFGQENFQVFSENKSEKEKKLEIKKKRVFCC